MFAEQVSARIVQEVTAEAVAVLKGEQESQRLPSGNTHTHTHIQTSKFIFDLLRLPGDLETKVQIHEDVWKRSVLQEEVLKRLKKTPKKLCSFFIQCSQMMQSSIIWPWTLFAEAVFFFFSEDAEIRATLGLFFSGGFTMYFCVFNRLHYRASRWTLLLQQQGVVNLSSPQCVKYMLQAVAVVQVTESVTVV